MSHWIKLWTEILDDPKMGQLPDHLWRRAIEMFLFAGRMEDDGRLPSLNDMAWTLRTSTDELVMDLLDLLDCDHGILSQDEAGWFMVRKFEERQAPISNAERQERHRIASQKSNEYVTIRDKSVTKNVTQTVTQTEQIQNRTETETDPEQTTDTDALAVVVGSLSGVLDAKTVEQELIGWPHPEHAAALVAYARRQKDIKSIPAFVRSKLRAGWKPPPDNDDLAAYRLAAAKYPEVMTG